MLPALALPCAAEEVQLLEEDQQHLEALRFLKENAKLELLDWKWSTTASERYVEAQGTVRNISNEALRAPEVVVTWEAKDGSLVTSESALIDVRPLLPGQESRFQVLARHNPQMNKAVPTFQEFGGGLIHYWSREMEAEFARADPVRREQRQREQLERLQRMEERRARVGPALRTWYESQYRPAMDPVFSALHTLLKSTRGGTSMGAESRCSEVAKAVERFDASLLRSCPDTATQFHLSTLDQGLRRLSAACGRDTEFRDAVSAVNRAWSNAELTLRRYSISP